MDNASKPHPSHTGTVMGRLTSEECSAGDV